MKKFSSLALVVLPLLSGISLAQTPPAAPTGAPPANTERRAPAPPARSPALEVALEGAQAALAACAADNLKVAVVVADSAGNIKVALVPDGTRGELVNFVLRKIAAAKEFKQSSSEVATRAKTDTELAARIAANPAWYAVPGAVPLKVGEEIIGFIGAGGANSEQDEGCAIAGANKIAGKLK